ncbi:MAG: L-idonate 5-dehydrogenase [Rhodobacteraceae bacterium]|nr:L-idonate 5-dehydrogenase [Paracoccaceae bacterium]
MKVIVIHAAKDLRIETRPLKDLKTGQVRVQVEAGGICGSDLHYYQHGGFGQIRVREPMILGHEISGRITETCGDAGDLKIGDVVAVSPSRPCGNCLYCDENKFSHCLNMRFYGSAMPIPHIQGAFRENLVADASQCHLISPEIRAEFGAFAEPLSVVLHGVKRAGNLSGKRVLITGCGPIGALCVLAARAAGAAEIVITDVIDNVLDIATQIGADKTINVGDNKGWTAQYSANKGYFDIMFEASGQQSALTAGLEVLRPRSVLVQLGLGGDVVISQNTVVAKEIDIRGAFRFHEEFADAVAMINAGTLNLAPLLTARVPIDQAVDAFELAGDRHRAMKVQIDFRNNLGKVKQ